MLTRLYIDNFRCFEKFEWRPGRKQLILGRNGTGKTSLMDALGYLRETAARGADVDLFSLDQRTRWLDRPDQIFEIDAQLKSASYRYRLAIEPTGDPSRPRVKSETVHANGVLMLESGEDRQHCALPSASDPRIIEFREWLGVVQFWRLNPFAMRAEAEQADSRPRVDHTNFSRWYRYLVQNRPEEMHAAFIHDVQECLDGFQGLRFEGDGSGRLLQAEFQQNGKCHRVPFNELSDGQRAIICLYADIHFVVARGGTVIMDEPDNFISLREIQPWLMALEDAVDDHGGQVILISHHPEILNQWANPYGVQFVREGAGRVTVEEFSPNPEYTLSAAELVARGWERE